MEFKIDKDDNEVIVTTYENKVVIKKKVNK